MSTKTTRSPFLSCTALLLNYKRQMATALGAAVLTAGIFGGGLGMILPTLQLLLGEKRPLHDLIEQSLGSADRPVIVQNFAAWLSGHVPSDPFFAFLSVMAVIAVLTLAGSCARYVHEVVTLTVVARVVMAWRTRLFRHLIRARMDQTLIRPNADHISRIVTDVDVFGRGLLAILGKAVTKLANGLAAVMLAMWLDWRLTLIAMIGTPLIGVLLRKFGKRIRRASRRLMQQRGHMIGVLTEALGGIRVVKVHHAEGYERRRFGLINRAVFNEEMRMRRVRALSSPVVETLGLVGVLAVASIAAWYIFRLNVAPAKFMTVLIALGAAATTLKPLATLNNQIQESNAAAARLLEILDITVEPAGPEDRSSQRLARHHRDVVFDAVTFSYPGQETPAISGVSLSVQHGQTVALVGANGSGKTTLVSLIPRLLEPTSGNVTIDGISIGDISLRSLRSQIAVVTQQSVLFEGTIAQNIAYGRLHEARGKIVAAAKSAYAHEFVAALRRGYDTVLGEGGEGLSGGQKQRLCIARAILRNPAILILDEATSQIDADSEVKINQALRQLRHGRTTFIIAHRLSTVIDTDLIAVMDQGRIVDQGTHTELLNRCDAYQSLTTSQLQPVSAT